MIASGKTQHRLGEPESFFGLLPLTRILGPRHRTFVVFVTSICPVCLRYSNGTVRLKNRRRLGLNVGRELKVEMVAGDSGMRK